MPDRIRQDLIFAHQEWLGFVQPVGLVVAPSVMVDAQVLPDRNISSRHKEFIELLEKEEDGATTRWRAAEIKALFLNFLKWEENDLVDASEQTEELEIALPELGIVLSSTWAVPTGNSESKWVMLIQVEDGGADLDKPSQDSDTWNATRHARFERLLRETGIPIGLLCNTDCIRLIYAPEGESSGHITFNFTDMASTAGRPILAAFDMLLAADALFVGAEHARLPSLLVKSRDAQVEVSTQLSRQVLAALYELLRGFVSADMRAGRDELKKLASTQPDHLYHGLITALMRLVFVLYTEDRGLMPEHPVYQQHYSLGGLFTRLRSDAAAWPDTMDQRFGAWAQLLSLFGLIHGGGRHENLSFVSRKGGLFDPDWFSFLEGRTSEGDVDIPMISDATVWNILRNLMILDGERLSYRTLDVEQIGSVYEAIMGFRIELTTGRSIAVRSKKRTGAAVVVDLDQLLQETGNMRAKQLLDATDQKLVGKEATTLSNATEPLDVVALLDRKVDRDATPSLLLSGVPILQPTSERRRSGSHYTPRTLTAPIVSEALQPVFVRLGPAPRPEEILELKILDPATGSGAFLVEACRQLGAFLVDAWSRYGKPTAISTDEDELLHALRLVAQRCIYGVDRNPMAIELARLSLWLATFAKDHEFTFLDHALRTGDSLVGLTRRQIEVFHWKTGQSRFQMGIEAVEVQKHLKRVSELRSLIRESGVNVSEQDLGKILEEVQSELQSVKRYADLVLTAFFRETNTKERELKRDLIAKSLISPLTDDRFQSDRETKLPLESFHWEIEFPEVFDRESPGFDVIVGNPPFAGKNTIASANVTNFPDWLKQLHVESHGNADLSAHFFRRAFNLLNEGGTLGLIATNTIAQGDTRSTGLRWICQNGGTIFNARRRIKWPGEAAVVVSVVHICKGTSNILCKLDNQEVSAISAFLFHRGGHEDPEKLVANISKSFQGSIVLGMGFTFDDTDQKGIASPISQMKRLIEHNSRNQEVIFPYIGGEEVNNSPVHAFRRHVINFGERDEGECWARYPDLMAIVEQRVRPDRIKLTRNAIGKKRAQYWWQYGSLAKDLYRKVSKLDRLLAISRVGQHAAITFLPTGMVYADSLIVFPFNSYTAFSVIQSRIHETWARFFGSSLKDDLRYNPSDCFETFPFPENWEMQMDLESKGKMYYEFRAAMMIRRNEGLTTTYNRFHDPKERDSELAELRKLHLAMDRVVLDAYGWGDIFFDCDFLLDYEIDEEEWGKKKMPWRYRWPDEIRDEVLARLMALNAERAQEERLAGRN